MKVLFCQLRNFGDIIRTFPLMDAVKFSHPDWIIGFTCYEEMENLCTLCSSIDVVIPQDRMFPYSDNQGGTRLVDCSVLEKSVLKAKELKFDVYIDLHGVFQSSLFGLLAEIPLRYGRDKITSKDGAFLFYTKTFYFEKNINRMERHFNLVRYVYPEIHPVLVHNNWKSRKIISIFPGSSQMGILKRWPIQKYCEMVVKHLFDCRVQLVFGPEDYDVKEYLKRYPEISIKQVSCWSDVKNVVDESRIVVGNDCAYLHMAIWKGVPTVMLLGPTLSAINGVWKYGLGENIESNISCCCNDLWKGKCIHSLRCMNAIPAKDVVNAIRKFL